VRGEDPLDFGRLGVPEAADQRWRNRMTEMWVRRALEYQDRGVDLLLAGQSPFGRGPGQPLRPVAGWNRGVLVDVSDELRRGRLTVRDSGRWDAPAVDAFHDWAAWHRKHAEDPRYRPGVIIDDSCSRMAWHRWIRWTAHDRRWCTHLLDTTDQPVAESVDQVEQWVAEQRDALRSGGLALSGGWSDQTATRANHDSS
jgi:hypothetical protein